MRLVGLAFEISLAEKTKLLMRTGKNSTHKIRNEDKGSSNTFQGQEIKNLTPRLEIVESKGSTHKLQALPSKGSSHKGSSSKFQFGDQTVPTEPTAVDIIAYAYYFIGLHKGT